MNNSINNASDIEKSSLEVHVEMSRMRYQMMLDNTEATRKKLDELLESINALLSLFSELKDSNSQQIIQLKESTVEQINEFKESTLIQLQDIRDSRNNQLIHWGTAIIGSLVAAIGIIVMRFVAPMFMK
jgi:adenylosuccinate synthase